MKSFSEFWVGVESGPIVVEVSVATFTNIEEGGERCMIFPVTPVPKAHYESKLNSVANITSLYKKIIFLLGGVAI